MKKWISPSRRVTSVFLLAMLLAAFIPILCGWIFYTRSSSVTAAQEKQMHEKSLQIVLQRFGDSLDEITNRCVTLAYDLRGMNFPAQDALTAHDRLAIHDAAKKLETVRSSLSVNADALYLFSPDSGYAIFTKGFVETDLLYKTYYQLYGVSREAFDALHSRISWGELVPVDNSRAAYIMTGAPGVARNDEHRQLVLLISSRHLYSHIQPYLLENARYTFFNSAGETVVSYDALTDDTGNLETYSASDHGYTLTVTLPSSSARYHTQGLRILYLCTLAAALLFSGIIMFSLTRETVMPIGQIISSIQEHFGVDGGEESGALETIADTVSAIVQEKAAREEELQRLRADASRARLRELLEGHAAKVAREDYVIAIFPGINSEQQDALEKVLDATIPPSYHYDTTEMEQAFCLVLNCGEGPIQSEKAADLLQSALQYLPADASLYCGMSMVHHTYEEAETAFHEAQISADCLPFYPKTAVLSFERVQYQPEYFMRDWHHLDKQLSFSIELGHGNYTAAQQILDTLFPDEYLQPGPATSVSELHLSSLKYQFLHDVSTALSLQENSFDDFGRLFVRDVLAAKTHADLRESMRSMLELLAKSETPPIPAEGTDETIRKICAYIRENYADQQLSVNTVADEMHMLPNTLTKLFSRKSGMGMAQYIQKVRMEHAKLLLYEYSEKPIAEIAAMCGYAAPVTFTRVFKQSYGMTPGEYRVEHGHKS